MPDSWTPPTEEELRATFDRLWKGYGGNPRESDLKDGVRSMMRARNGRMDSGRLGRFMTPEDWQNIAWAMASLILLAKEFPIATTGPMRRAARIWKESDAK